MLLSKVTIAGYRSITGTLTLHLDPAVTVVLGPNDHGKTNILSAIEHLNPDSPFLNGNESDLSWDCDDSSSFPSIEFFFEIADDERDVIANDLKNGVGNPDAGDDDVSIEDDEDADVESTRSAANYAPGRDAVVVPKLIVAERKGLNGQLQYRDGSTGDLLPYSLHEYTPRVELIPPTSSVADSVTALEIRKEGNGFMRGIFRYAGIDPDRATELFNQNPKTLRRLEEATATLNSAIKSSWSQGKTLDFLLKHNSAGKAIELHIKDPSVANRYVSASRRSAGFTQFFTIKTILFDRERANAAKSYIWLFDEPGIYLHPAGQQDLLQVIESLGRTNQVAYVTHSLFMINKSFPTRHRLVQKGESGTELEGKPFVGRWARALAALGMSLSGTILFANHVLLVEGDSDPIYINVVLQKMIEARKLDADLNSFAAIATGQSADADALIRILLESQPQPNVAILVDGDSGGKRRLERLKPILSARTIPSKMLKDGNAIEDYLPNMPDLFIRAVALYCAKLKTDVGEVVRTEDLRPVLQESFQAIASETSAADWLRNNVPSIVGLSGPPSKVGVAREYAILLQELPIDEFRTGAKLPHLVTWIFENLRLDRLGADDSLIISPV
jgi:predicted ATP-dependent endonuclease of OLD family